MTSEDFDRIEAYLGEPIPARYRAVMSDWPLDPNDHNSSRALPDDPDRVLAYNAMMRGKSASRIGPRRLVIGHSPCGGSYYLDLTGASPAVFVKYHDADVDQAEAPDLDAFVDQLEGWEQEAAEREAERRARARRRWRWPFGRRGGWP